MLNVVLYNEEHPVLFWDTTSNMFSVMDTERIPEEIYDHIWVQSHSEINPKSRVANNVRVVSKWLATKSKQPHKQVESLMHSIAEHGIGLMSLMSYDLGNEWTIHLTNGCDNPQTLMY